jgi:hypothetical protein
MNLLRYTAMGGAFALAATPALAQQAPRQAIDAGGLPMSVLLCELPVHHPDMTHLPAGHVHTPRTIGSGGPTATFQVTYNGFSPQAQAAFQAALDIWATHISSPIPIKINANWVPLGPNVLGSAGSSGLFLNFPGAPIPATWYANALADAISGIDQGAGGFELTANFNSNFASWYYGTDGNTPNSQWDLMGVVMHEVGHGLGFFGRGVVDDGNPSTGQGVECNGIINEGCWGISGLPVIYDRFVEDQAGISMMDPVTYPNFSIPVGTLLRSTQLYNDAPFLTATLGERGRLYAPAAYQYGSSYSHFAEGGYPAGTPNALMTPQIANGESFDGMGPGVCALFKDMGWPLGPDCDAHIVNPANEPGTTDTAAMLEIAGPNPFIGATAVQLTLREPADVRVELMDVTGRVVGLMHDGFVAAGVPTEMLVDGRGLQAGVYIVRVTGEAFAASRRLVLSR